jgi:hypothetical protein
VTLPFAFLQNSKKQQGKQWLLAVAGNRKNQKISGGLRRSNEIF